MKCIRWWDILVFCILIINNILYSRILYAVNFFGGVDRLEPEGNADGALGIFGKCRARVGYGPVLEPTKKRPYATLSHSVGRGTNTAASYHIYQPLRSGRI